MQHAWHWFVAAVWPTFLATLAWGGPAVGWHHYRIRRRLDAIHAHAKAAALRTDQGGDDDAANAGQHRAP